MTQFGLGDLLAVLVDADGDLDELAAVLVSYVDAVLAGVFGSDFGDHHAGELAAFKRDLSVLAGGHLLLVLEPGDLWGRLAPHGAGQAQGLERVTGQLESKCIHIFFMRTHLSMVPSASVKKYALMY